MDTILCGIPLLLVKSRILFIVPYPVGQVASQRFRFEQYLDPLKKSHHIEIQSFYSKQTFSILYKNGHFTEKVTGFLMGILRRLSLLVRLQSFDRVFIHREAAPLGPPVFEWLIARFFKMPLIYDFDDAIWMVDDSSSTSAFFRWLKFPHKVRSICRWSHHISAGNAFLADFASEFNPNISIIPTTIDTANYHVPPEDKRQSPMDKRQPSDQLLVIGWTGTHSTLPYLAPLIPILRKLQEDHPFIFKVICNQPPGFDLPGLQFVPWTKEHEISDLNSFDIGVMPLPDTNWAKGKCGFKILQYLALQIPSIASPVGVNCQIIKHGQNGFLCQSDEDWLTYLKTLLIDPKLRARLGASGRETVIHSYSTRAVANDFFSLFD